MQISIEEIRQFHIATQHARYGKELAKKFPYAVALFLKERFDNAFGEQEEEERDVCVTNSEGLHENLKMERSGIFHVLNHVIPLVGYVYEPMVEVPPKRLYDICVAVEELDNFFNGIMVNEDGNNGDPTDADTSE